MLRYRSKKELVIDNRWTVEQDGFLIENHAKPLSVLAEALPYTEEEIFTRCGLLGLHQRTRNIMRLDS